MNRKDELSNIICKLIDQRIKTLEKLHAGRIKSEQASMLKSKGVAKAYAEMQKAEKQYHELLKIRDKARETVRKALAIGDNIYSYNLEADIKTHTLKRIPIFKRLLDLKEGIDLKLLLAGSKQMKEVFESLKQQITAIR